MRGRLIYTWSVKTFDAVPDAKGGDEQKVAVKIQRFRRACIGFNKYGFSIDVSRIRLCKEIIPLAANLQI